MAIKKGEYKGTGRNRQQWNGRRWVSKPAKGFTPIKTTIPYKGSGRSRSSRRKTVTQSPGNQTDMKRGATYGNPGVFKGPGGNPDGSGQGQELKRIPAANRPKDMKAGRVYGDAGQPKAPKLPPKPKAVTPKKVTTQDATPKKSEAPKPTAKAKSSADRMRTWALANKKMIEKSGTKAQKAILAKALKPLKKTNNLKIRSEAQKTYDRSSS